MHARTHARTHTHTHTYTPRGTDAHTKAHSSHAIRASAACVQEDNGGDLKAVLRTMRERAQRESYEREAEERNAQRDAEHAAALTTSQQRVGGAEPACWWAAGCLHVLCEHGGPLLEPSCPGTPSAYKLPCVVHALARYLLPDALPALPPHPHVPRTQPLGSVPMLARDTHTHTHTHTRSRPLLRSHHAHVRPSSHPKEPSTPVQSLRTSPPHALHYLGSRACTASSQLPPTHHPHPHPYSAPSHPPVQDLSQDASYQRVVRERDEALRRAEVLALERTGVASADAALEAAERDQLAAALDRLVGWRRAALGCVVWGSPGPPGGLEAS